MKRRERAWPKGIIEIPSTRIDARADPQATQRISRKELDDALQRTKSGTRAIVREQTPSPEDEEADDYAFAGPRDSFAGPLDDVSVAAVPPSSTRTEAPVAVAPVALPRMARLHLTPRALLVVAFALGAFVLVAGIVGFLAGRLTHASPH